MNRKLLALALVACFAMNGCNGDTAEQESESTRRPTEQTTTTTAPDNDTQATTEPTTPTTEEVEDPAITVEVGDTIELSGNKWLVLDVQDSQALIISEGILKSSKAYYEDLTAEVFPVSTWDVCTLREYLNSEYYNSLNADMQSMILETQIQNTDGGADTVDKIFCLSVEEANKFFADDTARKVPPKSWWLRDGSTTEMNTREHVGYLVSQVESKGSIGVWESYMLNGVRPAMWITLD